MTQLITSNSLDVKPLQTLSPDGTISTYILNLIYLGFRVIFLIIIFYLEFRVNGGQSSQIIFIRIPRWRHTTNLIKAYLGGTGRVRVRV